MFKKITFQNGFRIILVPEKNTKAITVLVLVATGSKYEKKSLNGISHFLEHMFFKGTKKRSNALKIAESLDKIGGIYNAFTSKEFTGYFAKVDYRHLDLALDWVSDILLNSKIETKEIEKEKGVIIEELNMYLDTPTKYINDLWEKLLYGNQPAGWPIIGSRENILRFQRKDFLNYLKSHYSALNTILCLAGNFEQKKILEKIRKYFKKLRINPPEQKIKVKENQKTPQVLIHFKKTDQTHLRLGVRGYDIFHPKKYAKEILGILLGGNMSSRLFIQVREKRGLAYYIHSFCEFYSDSGYLTTGAGVPHKEVEKVICLILKEYKKFKEKKISQLELQKAKDYLKGTLSLTLEASDARASFYALQELLTNRILTLEQKFAKIDNVTPQLVQEVAKEIFCFKNLNLVMIGPHKEKFKFQRLLKL